MRSRQLSIQDPNSDRLEEVKLDFASGDDDPIKPFPQKVRFHEAAADEDDDLMQHELEEGRAAHSAAVAGAPMDSYESAQNLAFQFGPNQDTVFVQVYQPPKQQQFGGVSMLHKLHPLYDRQEKHEAGWRFRLGEFLESNPVHYAVVFLLVVDVILVMLHILFADKDDDPLGVHNHAEVLEYISISILSIFCVEILGLIIAFGWKFFTHVGYVLDFVVVPTSLVLEITVSDAAGLLILLRLWRLIRVAHGVYESVAKYQAAAHHTQAEEARRTAETLAKAEGEEAASRGQEWTQLRSLLVFLAKQCRLKDALILHRDREVQLNRVEIKRLQRRLRDYEGYINVSEPDYSSDDSVQSDHHDTLQLSRHQERLAIQQNPLAPRAALGAAPKAMNPARNPFVRQRTFFDLGLQPRGLSAGRILLPRDPHAQHSDSESDASGSGSESDADSGWGGARPGQQEEEKEERKSSQPYPGQPLGHAPGPVLLSPRDAAVPRALPKKGAPTERSYLLSAARPGPGYDAEGSASVSARPAALAEVSGPDPGQLASAAEGHSREHHHHHQHGHRHRRAKSHGGRRKPALLRSRTEFAQELPAPAEALHPDLAYRLSFHPDSDHLEEDRARSRQRRRQRQLKQLQNLSRQHKRRASLGHERPRPAQRRKSVLRVQTHAGLTSVSLESSAETAAAEVPSRRPSLGAAERSSRRPSLAAIPREAVVPGTP